MTTTTHAAPEEIVRRYLDEHSGETTATVNHLLTTFGTDERDLYGRYEITTSLARVGIGMDQPLPFLRGDDEVHLFIGCPPERSNGNGVAGGPHGPTAPPPPRVAGYPIDAPSPPPTRRNRLRIALAVIGIGVAVAGAAVGGLFYGQGTRLSDTEVQAKVERQAARDKRVFTERTDAALARQKRKLTKQRKKAVAAAEQRGQQAGYANGQSAGYSAGHSTGVEQGKEQGVEEGIKKGSDELTCSDDLDVPLPACNF